MTAEPAASPYNHFRCGGCDGSLPLTLADRELITGHSFRQDDGDGPYCTGCLADLPADSYAALFHICGQPAPQEAPVAAVLTEPAYRPPAEDRFVSGYLRAWVADRDAALRAAAEHGCDPDWCTAYRWDGHHVPTCLLARRAAVRAGLPDTLAELGYLPPLEDER